MNRLVGLAILVALFVGCATPEQQSKTEGSAAGAAIGAAVGAGVGALFGGGKGAAIGAGAGGALGLAAGYSYANRITERHKELAGKENDLDARIKYATEINNDAHQYNEQLRKQIAELTPRVNELKAQVQRSEADQKKLQKEKKVVEAKLAEAKQNLALTQKEHTDLVRFRAKHGASKQLDAEIAKLENNLAQLKGYTKTLAALNQRI